MGITKNHQSEGTLRRMAEAAFPGRGVVSIRELTEGLCNAAYLLELTDGTRTVLKIAAADGQGLLRNEEGMMRAEVDALERVRGLGDVPVPAVYAHDFSRTRCSGAYFFMEALPGASMFSQRDSLPEATRVALHRALGRMARRVGSLTGERFGLLGGQARYDTLLDFFRALMDNVLLDAEEKAVDLCYPYDDFRAALERDADCFQEVTVPRLVHWDLWEGNIFVLDGVITGLIDWERAMWGEPFMDDRFRRHNRTAAFLEGYGQTAFSREEMRRILWYDVFLYLTMMTEGSFRQYPDDSQYRWVRPLMLSSREELERTR